MDYDRLFNWAMSRHKNGKVLRVKLPISYQRYIRKAAQRRGYPFGVARDGEYLVISPKKARKMG